MENNTLPEIIDLFSGCGGLSLGFKKEGFNITHGIELMPEAVETVSYNLHWRYGEESDHICSDITKMDPEDYKDKIGSNGCIVIGGPPCQAYSLAGRAKLRSLGEERENTNDKRGYLYQDFLRFVYGLDARAVVMENVPESTNYGGKNIPETVCRSLQRHGYKAVWTILNSADYGVPQIRERVIVLGIKETENKEISLPRPTHSSKDDRTGSHEPQFKSLEEASAHFRRPVKADVQLPAWVTVGDAFGDLPELFPSADTKYKLEKITAPKKYKCEPMNDYQRIMRNWFGSPNSFLTGNCFRKTLRDFPIFAQMKQGDNFVQASEIADNLFKQACEIRNITPANTEAYEKLKKEIVPPYDRDNFLGKWCKLSLNKPSHTLVAHLSVDTYSHIHPVEPRGISVREAARLQSFPDGFLLQCSMGDAFKQIGNAVPPLMANAVAKSIKAAFEKG